jgi:hypothetical protein
MKHQALALILLLGALSASAIQTSAPKPAPGQAKARTPNASSAHTNLTPAAPVASKVPASSEEDIRDIRQPRHLPTPIAWAAAAAGVILLSAAAFVAYRWIRRGKFLEMTPGEIALQQLDEARHLMDPEHAREYCFAASQIIRSYIEAQFHLHAPRLTTEEFLRDLVEVRETMLASHRALLGDFLEHCDLAKFAGWRYSMLALEDMHKTALDFVRQSAAPDHEPSSARSAEHDSLSASATSEPARPVEEPKAVNPATA